MRARLGTTAHFCEGIFLNVSAAAQEATQEPKDSFFSQLSYKSCLEEVASVGD